MVEEAAQRSIRTAQSLEITRPQTTRIFFRSDLYSVAIVCSSGICKIVSISAPRSATLAGSCPFHTCKKGSSAINF